MANQIKFYRGLTSKYLPDTTHKDAVYFGVKAASDTKGIIYVNNVAYGGDGVDIVATKADLANLENIVVGKIAAVNSGDDMGLYIYEGTTNGWVKLATSTGTSADDVLTALNAYKDVVNASIGIINTSIGLIETKNADQDASIVAIKTKDTDQDASIAAIKTKNADQDSSITNILTTISTLATKTYVDTQDAATLASAKTYTDDQLSSKLSSVYKYKGSVSTYADLPASTDVSIGDVYNVVKGDTSTKDGMNYAWTGTGWDALGSIVDLTEYVKTTQLTTAITTEDASIKNYVDGSVAIINSSISDISTRLANTSTNLTSYIDGKVTNINSSIGDVSARVATNTSNISANATAITALQTKNDAQDVSINANTTKNTAQDASILTINNNITIIDTSVNLLETNLQWVDNYN